MSQTTIKITGMRCPGCSGRVKRTVSALPGVRQADVVLETGTLTVDYDETQLADTTIFADTVKSLGFKIAGEAA
ncbi:MAG: cation transporter [Opitutaceae bacterium]|jgi:copper chaperone CopZ|nr:cation transporter [Opitutaceae bacterium]